MTKIRKNKNLKFYDFDPDDRVAWEVLREKISGMDDLSKGVSLGGSDVGVVMGLSEYKSRGALYYEMIGLKEVINPINAHIYRGHCLEDVIEKKYWRYFNPIEGTIDQLMEAARKQKPLRKSEELHSIVVNKKYPWLFYNVDYLTVSDEFFKKAGVLEIKSMYSTALDKWEQGITPQYVVQIQDYMMGLELSHGEIFILSDATFPVLFPMEANEALQKNILHQTKDFCDRVNSARKGIAKTENEEAALAVAAEFEPEVEFTLTYIEFLEEMHRPENLIDPLKGTKELLGHVEAFSAIKAEIANLTDDLVEPEVLIREVFVSNKVNTIVFDQGNITWKKKFTLPYKKFI